MFCINFNIFKFCPLKTCNISKHTLQEELWQEEVEVLKVDLEHKLDKMEFSPLRDYVNEKLKMLQDKMKALAAQRREEEAAGTKRRVIRYGRIKSTLLQFCEMF